MADVEKQSERQPSALMGEESSLASSASNRGADVPIETVNSSVMPTEKNEEEQSQPQQSPGTPPNGGLFAWLQVLAGFLAFFNSWGIVNAFGAYQSYYESDLLSHETPSTISWIGSIQGFFVVSATIITGRLLDAGYLRIVSVGGTIMLAFGMMMTSLGTEFYQIFLSQGVCVGIGSSCLFVSAVTTVAPYFTTRRALAIGIMASGSSLGGVLYPIMARRLIQEVGFPWATRIIGFIIFGTSLIAAIFLKSRLPPRKSGPFFDYPSFKDVPFMTYCLSCFLGFIGLYIPIFYIDSYAEYMDVDEAVKPYMVSILSAASVFGRLVPNFFADKTGPMNIITPFTLVVSILCYVWIPVKGLGGIIVFALLYGFFSGAYVSIPPSCVASMTDDMTKLGSRLGMNFLASGLGILIGTPVAGALITRMDGSFLGAQLFAGSVLILAAIGMVITRYMLSGPKLLHRC